MWVRRAQWQAVAGSLAGRRCLTLWTAAATTFVSSGTVRHSPAAVTRSRTGNTIHASYHAPVT
ncbi:MAG: hypothetical protein ACRDP8_22605, partial [Actinopolymorphaceae bacterium]